MTHHPKPLLELDFNNHTNEEINKLMETADVETLRGLLDVIIEMQDTGLISSYILKIINFLSTNFDLIEILDSLTQQIRLIESVNPIIEIYLKYIKLSQNGVSYEETKEVAKFLIKWTEKLPDSLPLDDLFSIIMNNTLDYFSDEYPSFINNLIAKNENIKLTKSLLLLLLKATVPARYSSWLITNIFEFFHNDKNLHQNIIEILIPQLSQTDDIQSRALFIIYFAFRYEADFFRLNDSNFGFTQKILIKYKETETKFDCSFHTFNSTRRLYTVISQKLKININSFVIKLNEDLNDKIIQYAMPLQILNIKPFETLNLIVLDLNDENLSNESEPIKNAEFIKPTFLNLFQDHINYLWDFLENEKFGQFVFEMIILYERYQNEEENSIANKNLFSYFEYQNSKCPLQSILLGDCDDPLQFKEMRRVFPTAIKVFTNNDLQYDTEINNKIVDSIKFLIDARYDHVSLAIVCSSIMSLNMKFIIPKDILQKGLIECKLQILRELIMNTVSISESDHDVFMSLINVALIKSNRNHVKEFFECIKKLDLPPETFIPFYKSIDQLEYSFYKDPDEAFICLLDLIPVDDFTVNLTIDRLFSPPTCNNIAQPFVHTIESWNAAFKFLLTPIAVKKLNTLLINLQIPCFSDSTLSCDFTYKGRNGIYNLGMTCYINALLQVFNAIQPFSLGLISYDTSQLTQFEIELRDILAQLRYVRDTVISTASFVDKIPNFKNNQQDAIEFMEDSFIRRLNLDLENNDITNIFNGQTNESICSSSDGQVLSETQEDFYILVLPTEKPFSNSENFSRLDQAFEQFFVDEPIVGGYAIDDTNHRVDAYHHKSITKWPDCLTLQLQRWEYSKVNGGAKLVHIFGFPVEIDPNELNCSKETVKCDFKYHLVGVVIHQGTAEQGHYYAVVEGDDKEWYLCDDKSIGYFDIKVLPEFAFGMSEATLDEDISTAYLLFYCRQDMPQIDVKIPSDLEEKLNIMNMNSWPQTIFRNGNFLSYVHELLQQEINPKSFNKDLLYLGFHAFIKISMCNDKIFNEWSSFLQEILFSSKSENRINNALSFFDYINDHVGKSLFQIFNRSQSIIHDLTNFISCAIKIASNSIKPLEIILQNIDLKCDKKQVLIFAFEMIELVCKENKVNWIENIALLQSLFQYFLTPLSKEMIKLVGNSHSTALNSFLGIYYNLYTKEPESSALNKAISTVFNMNNLNAIASSLKKCSNFEKLIDLYQKRRPEIFFNFQEASHQTKLILPHQQQNNPQSNYPSFRFNITSFSELMFSQFEKLRTLYSEKLESFIEPNVAVGNFLNQKILIHHFAQSNCEKVYNHFLKDFSASNSNLNEDEILNGIVFDFANYEINNDLACEPFIPDHSEDNSIIPIVLGFIKKFIQLIENGDENLTIEFSNLLARLSRSYPLSFGIYSNLISKAFQISRIEKVKLNMIEILRNIAASDQKIVDQFVSNKVFDASERILSSDIVSNSSIELLSILYNQANGSNLLASCTSYYLDHKIDIHGQMLINLLLPPYSLKPPLFSLEKKKPTSVLQIIIAVCLFNAWKEMVDEDNQYLKELLIYIKDALELGNPSDLYMLSKPFLAAKEAIGENLDL